MATTAVEDYLKQIYVHEQYVAVDAMVSMGTLAEALGVVPGTATSMVKRLADLSLVEYEPYTGVRLTESGRGEALRVLRRHRLIETFLVEMLGLDWSVVHEEAERLEHAVSDQVLERIDALLGYPSVDPHGDPIPNETGEIRKTHGLGLTECVVGQRMRVVRVTDQDEAFLRFADRHGLRPGSWLTVEQVDPVADAIVVRIDEFDSVTLGRSAAAKITVEEADASS